MYRIKTHAPDRAERQGGQRLCFYILSKGSHAGRPNWQPHANSFAVSADTEEDATRLYWTAFALWQSKGIYPYMKGSVIPFITIKDYKKLFEKATREIREMDKIVPALAKVQQLIDNAERQIQLGEQAKIMLSKKALGLFKK